PHLQASRYWKLGRLPAAPRGGRGCQCPLESPGRLTEHRAAAARACMSNEFSYKRNTCPKSPKSTKTDLRTSPESPPPFKGRISEPVLPGLQPPDYPRDPWEVPMSPDPHTLQDAPPAVRGGLLHHSLWGAFCEVVRCVDPQAQSKR